MAYYLPSSSQTRPSSHQLLSGNTASQGYMGREIQPPASYTTTFPLLPMASHLGSPGDGCSQVWCISSAPRLGRSSWPPGLAVQRGRSHCSPGLADHLGLQACHFTLVSRLSRLHRPPGLTDHLVLQSWPSVWSPNCLCLQTWQAAWPVSWVDHISLQV